MFIISQPACFLFFRFSFFVYVGKIYLFFSIIKKTFETAKENACDISFYMFIYLFIFSTEIRFRMDLITVNIRYLFHRSKLLVRTSCYAHIFSENCLIGHENYENVKSFYRRLVF